MREYTFHKAEGENWCVPACLQTILEARGFRLKQKEIAEKLGIRGEDGLDGNILEKLNEFLKPYNLTCIHQNPFLGGLEADLLLRDTEKRDILIAHKVLREGEEKKHFSLFLSYELLTDNVRLLDPGRKDSEIVNIPLNNLVNLIQAKYDRGYGFYIIS